jgi:hypothetical protein
MLVQGQNLFPLNNTCSAGSGYFMNALGQVFSTKSGNLLRLSGSTTKSGRYYTLNGRTHREDQLVFGAKRHKDFTRETSPAPVVNVVDAPVLGARRSYATSMQEAIKLRGTMIATVQGEKLVFGTDPKIHTTEQSWREEMARLATVSPGTKFVAVKIVQSVVAGNISWE